MRWYRYRGLPKNSPREFLDNGRQPSTKSVVVCAGDSLTQGQISGDYVALLRRKFSGEDYEFINAGINGDLGYNLLQRLAPILACRPDTVVLLVGTNDINATLSPDTAATYRKNKHIPVTPTPDWSAGNIAQIFEKLAAADVKNIAILSIPMLGENLDSELNSRVVEYNQKLRDLAAKYHVEYLPLHESLLKALPAAENPPVYRGSMKPILLAAFKKIVLRQSLNTISKGQRLHFLTDHIHLNERGAEIVGDLIERYLRDLSPNN